MGGRYMKKFILGVIAVLALGSIVAAPSSAQFTSVVGIGDCSKLRSVVLIDKDGKLYGYDADQMDLDKIKVVADKLAKGHALTVKICSNEISTGQH
jgi:hypothetical protein